MRRVNILVIRTTGGGVVLPGNIMSHPQNSWTIEVTAASPTHRMDPRDLGCACSRPVAGLYLVSLEDDPPRDAGWETILDIFAAHVTIHCLDDFDIVIRRSSRADLGRPDSLHLGTYRLRTGAAAASSRQWEEVRGALPAGA
ncbi:hypothetical protein [Cereibacter sphaeroides]|uniref:hypothetical protein n=2 Tax=Cereibacter sphaeroides TaxID=1063 RepID=UPI001F191F7D|nr:hypothetical protein [Cereibacter sphaeroides]